MDLDVRLRQGGRARAIVACYKEGMSNHRPHVPALLLLSCAVSIAACTEEISTTVNLELIFPAGEDPLADARTLRVTIRSAEEDLVHTISRPSSGSWSGTSSALLLGHVDLDPARISVEGLDSEGVVICEGESIAIPLVNGRPGRVVVFVQTLGTSGLAPALQGPWVDHGAAYLEGGGVLLAGGPESAPSSEAWVYALDWYEPVEMDRLDERKSLVGVAPLGGDRGLLWGGTGSGGAFSLDPAQNRWVEMGNFPEGLRGSWPRPLWDSTSRGGVLTLRDRTVALFTPGTPPSSEVLISELEEDITPETVTSLSGDLAVITGSGDVSVLGIELNRSRTFEIPAPSLQRTGHVAAALSDGRFVLVGGEAEDELVEDVEVLDADQEEWSLYEGLLGGLGRVGGTVSVLSDDRLILAGGWDLDGAPLGDAVVIDFVGGSSEPTVSEVIELAEARARHTATVLPMGVVMFVGGESEAGDPLESVEILRPSN